MSTVAIDSAQLPRYGLRHACRAEVTKLFSLRSTWWTLALTVVGSLLVTALATNSNAQHQRAWYQGFDSTATFLSGGLVALLTVGVLGALTFTSEYGSGTIRSSMAATPRRLEFALAKYVVVGVVSLVVGELIAFSCFGLGHAIFAGTRAPATSLAQPAVLRAVLLSGVTLAVLGLIGAGLGAAIRRTAGAISAYAALVFVVPLILTKLPGRGYRFTPLIILGNSIAATVRNSNDITAHDGFLVVLCYGVAFLALGALVAVRRDP